MRPLLTVPLLALSLAVPAFSCSCVSSSACPGLGGKDYAVFRGTVLGVRDLPRTNDFVFLTQRAARIQVDESFGGVPTDVREVEILTGAGGGDCGVPFKPGEAWLVAAYRSEDGRFRAGICGHTQKVDRAGVALGILRLRRSGQPVPTLAGQIAQHNRDFTGTLGTHAPKPLSNAVVRIKSGDKEYETRSDTGGLFAFYNLPSGRYQFVPDLPPGTSLAWYIGSDSPAAAVEIKAGACHEHNIDVFPSASVQGRALDPSGKVLPHAFVYIVPAAQAVLPHERKLYWESQGKEGFFRFLHIPPGQYRIVVNPGDELKPDFPYRRTFYPGVHDQSSAAIIEVRDGEQIRDADIRLKPSFTPRNLTVRVVWSDGRIIRDFVYIKAAGTANPRASAHTSQPDPKVAEFDLKIVPDEPYEIQAELTCRYADHRSVGPGSILKSNRLFILPDDQQTQLLLTLPAAACPQISGKRLLTEHEDR